MTVKKLVLSLVVISTFGFAVFVHFRADARERAAEAAFPPEGQFIALGTIDVHAVVRGSGPDLVLIHGLSGNARDFTFSLVDKLAENYRVIVFDRPGLGWTDPLPEGADGISEQAALLQRAAEQLGAERPIVLGQSYGGAVALAWAVHYPDSIAALVTLGAPSHVWEGGLSALYTVTSNPVGSALAVPLITALVPEATVRDATASVFEPQTMPAGYDDHIGAPLTLRRETLRANARHRAGLKEQISVLTPAYPRLTLPFELVHGEADEIVSLQVHAEEMIQDAPHANLTRLPGIGHMPQHVAEDQVIAAIDRAATRAGLR